MRKMMWALAAAAVASLSGSTYADDPNQILADSVAETVTDSGRIRGYHLDIEANHGVVTLTGDVASAEQREMLIEMVQNQPGVLAVRDRVNVRDASTKPAGELRAASDVQAAGDIAPDQQVIEPEPVYDYQGGVAPFTDAPVVPPYSWPSYTPYNNYASMAYQTQYPSGAWPFIGPPYPYPMIPSGWRRVSLTWKKGYWWMRFHAH